MAHLAALTAMERLNVFNANLTDDGLKYLASMRQLTFLGVSGTITDAGLQYLTPLKALGWLKIDTQPNRLSPEALANLQAQLPQLAFLGAPNGGFGGGMAATRVPGN